MRHAVSVLFLLSMHMSFPAGAAGDTCETALPIGTIPPNYSETGIVTPAWRSFVLSTPRKLRIETPPALSFTNTCLFSVCDQFEGCNRSPAEICLDSGTHRLGIEDNQGPHDLQITDLGPCFPPPKLLLRIERTVDLNGDQDGYPDTGETVDVYLRIANRSGYDFTNVVAAVASDDSNVACIPASFATLALAPAHGETDMPVPFRFTVAPGADRAAAGKSVTDLFQASFKIRVTADQFAVPVEQDLALELDLDAMNPAGPTSTFVEGFEAGFGSFTFQNLDTNKASNSASDGYRCQYNDPDYVNSSSYGITECYLGFANPALNINDWHIHGTSSPDGGRAYEGTRAAHFGRHSAGNPNLDTYDIAQLDALRSRSAINLAARVCRDDPAPDKRACATATDCSGVGGGPCVSASPELSFKQQVSLMDQRLLAEVADRAVVMARIEPGAIWRKLQPYRNVYASQPQDFFSNCSFDPIDDGNDEDSYFDPGDPQRRYGPSSTCYPEFAFTFMGHTDGLFDPEKIGDASDGPGLAGALGPGTWVESRFDLSSYRGRSVSLRFLVTSLSIGEGAVSWHDFFLNTTAVDDGWYLDDIRVTQTLGLVAPVPALDNAPPPAQPDGDGDSVPDACDCAPADPTAFAFPAQVAGFGIAPDRHGLSWNAVPPSGTGTRYDVLRGAVEQLPVGAGGAETCLASGSTGTSLDDPALPASGHAFYYLVRARNACGKGSYGTLSSGAERTSSACP